MYNLDYKLDYVVEYTNDEEYRNCVQNVFMINVEEHEDPEYIIFDEIKVKHTIEKIYELTCRYEIFTNLYVKAANKILSEDAELGLIILFSYDYLNLFHKCLNIHFNENNKQIAENNECFIELIKNLENKKE